MADCLMHFFFSSKVNRAFLIIGASICDRIPKQQPSVQISQCASRNTTAKPGCCTAQSTIFFCETAQVRAARVECGDNNTRAITRGLSGLGGGGGVAGAINLASSARTPAGTVLANFFGARCRRRVQSRCNTNTLEAL